MSDEPLTEKELAKLESDSHVNENAWPDETIDLGEEVRRLLAEVRRLRAAVQAHHNQVRPVDRSATCPYCGLAES